MNHNGPYAIAVKLYKFYLVEDAMQRHDYNVKMAADELGVTLKTIYLLMGGKKKWARRVTAPTQEERRA